MDEIIVIIMGIFIANYKVENYPYLSCVVKASIVAIAFMIFVVVKDIVDIGFNIDKFLFGIFIAFIMFVVLCFYFMLLHLFFKGR